MPKHNRNKTKRNL